ncbi:MAG: hypothetical protein JXR78_15505, partial [Victivallales bacterium]|nr:hypothetical protein [Victivallales bacterium]
KEYSNDALPTANFTISMNGKLIPPSGGTGPQPTWGASGNAKAPFYIKSNQDGGAKEIVVKAGTSVTYTAYEGTSSKSSNWTVNNQTKNNESSIIFSRSWWDVPGWFSASMGTPDPGIYNITASPTDNNAKSDSGKMTVVGVDKIDVKIRNENYKTSDTVTYVAVDDSLSVKAFPLPNAIAWPDGTPEWSTSGDEWFSSRVYGVGEEKSVDTSTESSGFYIIATCGTSEKRIEVKIYQCTLVVYVQAPIGGPVGITGVFDKTITVGHAFWELKVSNFAVNYLKNNELSQYSDFLNNKHGFYPATGFGDFMENQTGPGILGTDNSHSYDKSKDYDISYNSLVAGLSATKSLSTSPGTYTLGTRIIVNKISSGEKLVDFSSTNDRNCATVCRNIASQAGVSLPNAFISNWSTSSGDLELNYSGNCPYVLKNNL